MKQRKHSSIAGLALLAVTWPVGVACGPASPASGAAGGGASSSAAPGTTPPGRDDAGVGDAGPVAPVGSDAGGAGSDSGGGGSDGGGGADAGPVVIHYIPGVTVSTLAGSDVAGTQDGTGVAAQFDNPTGMALDAEGRLLVTDYDSARVRLVTPAGVVTTLAAATGFVDPFAAVVASDGTYYIETDANSSGVKDAMTGTIWRVTPTGGRGLAAPTVVAAGFGRPRGLAAIAGGNLFVVDRTQEIAERLTAATGGVSFLAGSLRTPGFRDAPGAQAEFDTPVGAAPMSDGSVLVTDSGNNRVRRVAPDGRVTTFAGDGVASLVDGPCASARFDAPRGVAVDAAGNVYVSDIGNHVIRRIRTDCTVETVAGDCSAGFNDGAGNVAELYGQEGIGVTPDGKTLYVADGNGGDGSAHHRIRVIAIP